MAWWLENSLRMIQNNLRDIDAKMDIDRYIDTLKDFGANACMVGCGGITSFYPTNLEFQYRNPYMEGDFFGNLLEKCHKNGIRVIARFDFSKTHASIYEKHKEWFTKSIHGEPVRYHDTVATCVNGRYQQECTLEILKEILTRYPVDGVFFNMFGYQTRDYSDNYVGICQCDSCKTRFRTMYGMELPKEEKESDEAFLKYKEFKQLTVDALLNKISSEVRKLNPEVLVCTYNHKGVDMVRNESNSAVDRPYPFWLYNSENNVAVVEGSFEDKISSNCVINAVDIYYRFMGVSKYLNQIRLYGDMASGGGLDWCIIGDFEDYPDRDNFDKVKEVFRFHEKYEKYFGNLKSQAKILLINPAPFGSHSPATQEYLGIFKMLKEEHRLFDVVDAAELDGVIKRLDRYELIILPGIRLVKSSRFLQALKNTKAGVAATGLALMENAEVLTEIFGVRLKEKLETVRGGYLLTEPKSVFTGFEKRDWVYLDKEYYYMETSEENVNYLPLVAPARYGPPERCYGHEITGQPSAAVKGRKLYLPWQPGTLYYKQGFEDFKYILFNLMDAAIPVGNPIKTDAPKQVEVFFDQCGQNEYLLQFLNLSGFNGTTFFEAIPIHHIGVTFNTIKPKRIYRLTLEGSKEVLNQEVLAEGLMVPVLDQYEAYLIEV